MLIKKRESWALPASTITPKPLYKNRREIIKSMGLGLAAGSIALRGTAIAQDDDNLLNTGVLQATRNETYSTDEERTSYEAITSYNNFYEFGTGKNDPARYADRMQTSPWSVKVEGHVEKAGTYSFDDLIKDADLEERIYRLRCVEAWSMVVPWIGVPLHKIINRLGPTTKAKYVQFETLADPSQMPGLRSPVLNWPYVEGLRLDEALHPLTMIATGLYGEPLPNQNGAPMRLVVPWKYGFKSIKSIVAIRFVENQPKTSWNEYAPSEYGFYSNVNPDVRHPRWSQATERRIGEFRRRKTLKFNGYEEEVAGLYAGMDLAKYY